MASRLCTTMKASDVTDPLDLALTASELASGTAHRSRVLSDNGPSQISGDLVDWLVAKGVARVRGAQTILRPRVKTSAGIRH